ncbi:NAD-dependent epimerase/dehydratase family protein [Rubrolithibacter danxiaensis]|uniref:NAD-dependent epimerase/dehydratase family protein n=1 Tax=Rubrolithibacter danxiaensis TaxID=3390805 RepID=UPI003BF8FFA3
MILVTGATGFLGSELVLQLLTKGERIRAVKRAGSVIPEILRGKDQIEWATADILDYYSLEDAFEGITKVYHCAALISFDPDDKNQLIKQNAEGTANVVNLCFQNNIEKLIHVSSVAAIGEAKKDRLITENDHWEFDGRQHAYSISKYQAEMEVWRAIAEGLNAAIVNPSLIIGKNAGKKGSGQLFETVKKGMKFYPSGSCGLVDVEDVAKIMIVLMESDISGERFLVNAENWNYKSLFNEIASSLGIKAPSAEAKPWMLGLAWRSAKIVSLITGKKFGITKGTARSASKIHEYSNEKIKSTLNFTFKPIKQTIKEICESLKEHTRE